MISSVREREIAKVTGFEGNKQTDGGTRFIETRKTGVGAKCEGALDSKISFDSLRVRCYETAKGK